MPEAYKFPDEVEDKHDDETSEIEVEIVDDVPEQDRGRSKPDKVVEDPTDDEIESYSDKVQHRIKDLTYARHEERRAKEAVLREKQELERLTHHLLNENNTLKKSVNNGQEAFAHTNKERAAAEMDAARRKLKDAHEAFDTDAIIAAQEEMTEAKMRFEAAKNFRPTPLQEQEIPVQPQTQRTQAVQPDEQSLRWQAKNQWFGADGYEEVTALALAMHQRLTQENGQDYARTSDYFERIDARLRDKFPEVFGAEERSTNRDAPVRKPPATVVAPGTRSSGVRKIKLTKTQESTARRLGLTPQQYAVEVLKLEASNG